MTNLDHPWGRMYPFGNTEHRESRSFIFYTWVSNIDEGWSYWCHLTCDWATSLGQQIPKGHLTPQSIQKNVTHQGLYLFCQSGALSSSTKLEIVNTWVKAYLIHQQIHYRISICVLIWMYKRKNIKEHVAFWKWVCCTWQSPSNPTSTSWKRIFIYSCPYSSDPYQK